MYFYVNWYMLMENRESKVERNTFNATFQFVKLLSLLVETFVLILLCSLFRYFVNLKR